MHVVIVVWLATVLAGLGLEALQLRYLARHGHGVPPELDGVVDESALRRMQAYALDRGHLQVVRTLVLAAAAGLFFFAGGLDACGRVASGVGAGRGPFVGRGLLFFLGLVVLETLLEVPFSLVSTFRIEARHGFNRTTPRLWLFDQAKGLGLSLALSGILVAGGLVLVASAPRWWWLWVWGFSLAFGVLLVFIAPHVIAPLFNRYRPIERPDLEVRILDLAERAGLRVSRIQQMDASRRSGHSNAYFTGIGPAKRIVLFDTLLGTLPAGEVLAVLAHEMGHWKLRHVAKRFALGAAAAFVGLLAASRLVAWDGLPGLFGVRATAFPVRALLAGFLASLLALPTAPLASWLSRRDEWQADAFARRLTGRAEDLARALALLARDNLANLHPHPLYAWAFHSHPPVVARIRGLRSPGGEDRE